MTDNPEPWTEAGADGPEALNRVLRDPAVWAEPSPEVGDRVLAAIVAERYGPVQPTADPVDERWPPPTHRRAAGEDGVEGGSPPTSVDAGGGSAGGSRIPAVTGRLPVPDEGPAPVVELERAARRWFPLAAAAVVAFLALGAFAIVNLGSDDAADQQLVALAPTDLAPEGSIIAEVEERPNGVRIVLDLADLPPAPEGFFYQAWLVRPEPRNAVSAGTWHLRGGDGTIELWAGVSTEVYTTITVTLSPESDPTSPGDRLFAGQLEGRGAG